MVVDDQQPDRAHGVGAADEPAAIAGTRAESAVPPPGSDSIASDPATRATRWRMPLRPKPDGPARIGLGDGEPDAVVADVEGDDVADERQRQPGARGAGVPGDVRERLLGDAQQRDLDLRMERDDVAGHGDLGRDAVELRPLAGDIGERIGQRPRLERGGHRRLDRPAGLGQALARQPLGVLQVPVPIGRAVVRLVGRLELGHDPDQALGDRVVDLAGHPGALVEDARPRAPGSAAGRGARRSRRARPRAWPAPAGAPRSAR